MILPAVKLRIVFCLAEHASFQFIILVGNITKIVKLVGHTLSLSSVDLLPKTLPMGMNEVLNKAFALRGRGRPKQQQNIQKKNQTNKQTNEQAIRVGILIFFLTNPNAIFRYHYSSQTFQRSLIIGQEKAIP